MAVGAHSTGLPIWGAKSILGWWAWPQVRIRRSLQLGAAANLDVAKPNGVVIRRDDLAETMPDYLIKQIEATDNVKVIIHAHVVEAQGKKRLECLVLEHKDTGQQIKVSAAGDVRSGAMNRVASAVGEGAKGVSMVRRYLADW